jgi:hypothetical protein
MEEKVAVHHESHRYWDGRAATDMWCMRRRDVLLFISGLPASMACVSVQQAEPVP